MTEPDPAGRPVRPRRWLWIAVLIAVMLLLGTLAVMVSDRQPADRDEPLPLSPLTGAPMPHVPADLLLTPPQVAAALGIAAISDVTPADHVTAYYGDRIVDNDCVAAIHPATTAFYRGTGYTEVRTQSLHDPASGPVRTTAEQTVTVYPGARDAVDTYAKARDTWTRCSGRTINARSTSPADAPDLFIRVGPIHDTDGILAMSLTEEGGEGWVCQRGISADDTTLIDVKACGFDMPATAVNALIDPIRANVAAGK